MSLPVLRPIVANEAPGTAISAAHAVVVALRYLSGFIRKGEGTGSQAMADRRELWRRFLNHAEWGRTLNEVALSDRIIEVIEKQERRSAGELDPQQADHWIRELAQLTADLSRAGQDLDLDRGRQLLDRLRVDSDL